MEEAILKAISYTGTPAPFLVLLLATLLIKTWINSMGTKLQTIETSLKDFQVDLIKQKTDNFEDREKILLQISSQFTDTLSKMLQDRQSNDDAIRRVHQRLDELKNQLHDGQMNLKSALIDEIRLLESNIGEKAVTQRECQAHREVYSRP
jgi:organic radical activating enzyme